MTIEEWAKDFKSYVNALDMPRDDYNGIMEYIDDALAMLKEQEAKTVVIDLYGNYCPWCSTKTTRAMGVQKLHLGTKFCPYCGERVKWND